mmetsp:Transcript_37376/g.93792  ORF Transcript_37376/g.93792 Transcript_37376/m.93792 type:complete len:200 (-) Transcript_37376:136-735(-)
MFPLSSKGFPASTRSLTSTSRRRATRSTAPSAWPVSSFSFLLSSSSSHAACPSRQSLLCPHRLWSGQPRPHPSSSARLRPLLHPFLCERWSPRCDTMFRVLPSSTSAPQLAEAAGSPPHRQSTLFPSALRLKRRGSWVSRMALAAGRALARHPKLHPGIHNTEGRLVSIPPLWSCSSRMESLMGMGEMGRSGAGVKCNN